MNLKTPHAFRVGCFDFNLLTSTYSHDGNEKLKKFVAQTFRFDTDGRHQV